MTFALRNDIAITQAGTNTDCRWLAALGMETVRIPKELQTGQPLPIPNK